MSLLPLPPPPFGADVATYRLWIDTALFEVNQALRYYPDPGSPAHRQLSCLFSFLASSLSRLDRVCSRRPGYSRGSEFQLLLWRKTSWLCGKYHTVRDNLYQLLLDGDLSG